MAHYRTESQAGMQVKLQPFMTLFGEQEMQTPKKRQVLSTKNNHSGRSAEAIFELT